MSTTFAARLNRLFDTVYPPGRGQHTSAEVIAALKAEGITMSAPYLSQLRSGNRTNPSAATMAALANFFRIKTPPPLPPQQQTKKKQKKKKTTSSVHTD